MPKVTQHQLDVSESSIIDVYQHLEQQLFEDFVNRLRQHGLDDVDQTNVLQWQMEVMNDLHLVNSDVVSEASKATGIANSKLVELFQHQGYKVVDQEYTRATKAAGRKVSTMQVNTTKQVLDGYLKQTFRALDNNVNQTLLSTNYGDNAATKTYQQIVKETTADVLAGLRTPEQALKATLYRWRDKGIDLNLVDKGGHHWGLESYARLVVDNTTNRAFQAVRDQAAEDVGVDTFVMSSHEASRAACAPIQGKLVTTRSESFTDANSGEHFESLYDHGYDTPSGTFGINCHHLKWLYVPGASSNNQPQYDPDEAIAKGNMVAKQRELERRIRAYKQKQALAEKMIDDHGVTRNMLLIRRNQAALRKLVGDHDYLHRDYSREQKYALPTANSKDQYAKKWYAEVQRSLGTAGLPDEASFVKAVRKGGREGRLLRRYIEARRKRKIEPVADFALYKEIDQQMASRLHGVTAANGMTVTGHSLHSIERVIGTRYYTNGKGHKILRKGVSISDIQEAVTNGKIRPDTKRFATVFVTRKCQVVVNQDGNIVTVIPQ